MILSNKKYVDELSKGSHKKIQVKCDICGREKLLSYKTYLKNLNHGNYYACSNTCSRKQIIKNNPIIINNYKIFSYLIGLFQTDGNLYDSTRNRGKFQIELSKKDADIIYKIKDFLISTNVNCTISTRVKNTNFGVSNSITLSVQKLQFRDLLKQWGVPSGKKSIIISPPLHQKRLSINNYIRGLYDGDGSLGFTKTNFPFVSFTTQSENVKNFLLNFISEITFKPVKDIAKNKRDNVYNFAIYKEDAQLFCKNIYPTNCLSINRKYQLAQNIKNWNRPPKMVISNKKRWDSKQDNYILSHTILESMAVLNRSKKSIQTRLWRIK